MFGNKLFVAFNATLQSSRLILESLNNVKNFGMLRLIDDIGAEGVALVERDHVKRHLRKMLCWMANVTRTNSETFEKMVKPGEKVF